MPARSIAQAASASTAVQPICTPISPSASAGGTRPERVSIGVWIIEGNGVARAIASSQSGNHTIGMRKPESRFIVAL